MEYSKQAFMKFHAIVHDMHKRTAKEFFTKYERSLALMAFVGGFLWDTLTLTRIDVWIDNLMLFSYIGIAIGSIAMFNLYELGRLKNDQMNTYAPWLPLVMQFAFGGLFSGYVVYYMQSAVFVTSWPFMLLLGALLVGNEFFEKHYKQLTFNVSMLYIAIFSFLTFYVPIITGSLGAGIFLISGVLSLLCIGGILYLFLYIIPERMEGIQIKLVMIVGGIYALFNILYFTNIIPPIPLSLIESGIYYNIERQGDDYLVTREDKPWYLFWQLKNTVYRTENNAIYSYSAVFAPTKLQTTIMHRWAYKNPITGSWVQTDIFPYTIRGGRDGGYRGYSVKNNLFAGRWRVDVITSRNQLIGRTVFTVENTDYLPELTKEIR